jgi:hypothetical protein
MLTMGKSMLLEQVELRHEICVAAAARSVDGVVAPVVAATTHNSPDRVSSKARHRATYAVFSKSYVGKKIAKAGPVYRKRPPIPAKRARGPSDRNSCFRQSAGPL